MAGSVYLLSVVRCLALALWCPLGRRRRSLVVLVEQPVLLWVVQRVYHFWHELELFRNLQHCSGILVASAVISSRENSEELTACEALKAVHHTFVGAEDKLASVCVKEVLHAVRTELYDVACAVRVSDEIWLDAQVLVAICRVRPQNVDDELLLRS